MKKIYTLGLVLGVMQSVLSQTGDNLFLDNSKYINAKTNTGFNTRILGINGSNNLYLGSVDAPISNLIMNFGGQDRLVINGANGNIGIGTANPQALLNINIGNGGANGTPGIRVGGTDNYASLEFGIDGAYDGMIRSFGNNLKYYAGHWKVIGNMASENHNHTWYTSKAGSNDWSTVKMILNENGNLGIGTANPQVKLHLIGRMNITDGQIYQTGELPNDNNAIFVNNSAGGYGLYSKGGNGTRYAFHFENQVGESIILGRGNGNIGIGTINPSEKIDISKDIAYNQVNSSGIKFGNANSTSVNNYTSHAFILKTQGDANGIRFGIIQQSRLNNDIEVFSIKNDNVGIGTTTPDSKLTVKGSIHAEEVKVDLSVPAPDYVFKEDYNLRTLEETQEYIKENGHLPNIPSAKEMEENGVELGLMNMKLLEKIEELTLYTLEQHKDLEIKESRIKTLENELLDLKVQFKSMLTLINTLK